MQIVCPDCATSYQIDPAALGRAGRQVRCARCKTSWVATPQAEPQFAMAFSHPDVGSGFHGVPLQSAAPSEPADVTSNDEPPAAADNITYESAESAHDPILDPLEEIPAPATAATVETIVEATDAPPLVPEPPHQAAVIESEGNDIETLAARRARQLSKRRRRRNQSNLALAIAALIAIDAALIAWRTNIVRLLPQTASFYSAIGLPVNLRGLLIQDVSIARETHDGIPLLVIQGAIVNDGMRPVEVPRLRFAALGADKVELYAWTAMPERSVLDAGEALAFRSRLASPPDGARNVMVRFLHRRDLTGTSE